MSIRSFLFPDYLNSYYETQGYNEPDALRELRQETDAQPVFNMQVSPEQGQLLQILVGLSGAKSVLEIGTFMGYSSLAMALTLPDNGRMICCDVNRKWTQIAKKHWEKSGVAHKIDLRIAPALETLDQLIYDQKRFDLVFIDADKVNYVAYYEKSLQLLNPSGMILLDNTLWSGKVAQNQFQDKQTKALRQISAHVANDDRVRHVLLPIGDGLTLVQKLV